METLYDQIPSLDLNEFTQGSSEKKSRFVKKLGETYQNIGFISIRNHGLSDKLMEGLYTSIKAFFALPEKIKKKYEKKKLFGQRGYVGREKERAKGRDVYDLKEFYHIGQPTSNKLSSYPENIFPKEIPSFEKTMMETYNILQNTGMQMLRALALFLALPENYFDNKVSRGNSILRAIHYYPIENPDQLPTGAVRAASHGDINLITLLMGASADGLQVLRRDNQWIPVTALPNQIVVNVGDMLERLTNNKLKSTIHRVVNPSKKEMYTSRFSVPFFMHPISEMDLTCLENCVSEKNPKCYGDITAEHFLDQRLQEIGLKN